MSCLFVIYDKISCYTSKDIVSPGLSPRIESFQEFFFKLAMCGMLFMIVQTSSMQYLLVWVQTFLKSLNVLLLPCFVWKATYFSNGANDFLLQ